MFRVALYLRRRLAELSLARASDATRCSVAVTLAALMVMALGVTTRNLLSVGLTHGAARGQAAEAAVRTSGAYFTTSDNWLDQLTNPSAWRDGRFRGRSRPTSREEARREREEEEREAREERRREEREAREEAGEETMERARRGYGRARGTYRTVCVRLCDGFFFPISFATTPDRFGADENACRSRCGSPARLYVYPNPGGEPEQMADLGGQPYLALKSAFLFRTEYVEACTCKPHPWGQEALARHRLYAEQARKDRQAVTAKVHPTARASEGPIDTTAVTPSNEPDAAAGPATPVAVEVRPANEFVKRRTRLDGAMLLGSPDTKRSTRRGRRSQSAERGPSRERRSTGSDRRAGSSKPEWASRVFGGNY
jgi:hypothetical protein